MALLLAIGCFIAFRPNAQEIPNQAMWIFRVVMALSGAAFAVILTGFLDIAVQSGGWKIRTGGGLAVFLLLYLSNPPGYLRDRLRSPHKPVRVSFKRKTSKTDDKSKSPSQPESDDSKT